MCHATRHACLLVNMGSHMHPSYKTLWPIYLHFHFFWTCWPASRTWIWTKNILYLFQGPVTQASGWPRKNTVILILTDTVSKHRRSQYPRPPVTVTVTTLCAMTCALKLLTDALASGSTSWWQWPLAQTQCEQSVSSAVAARVHRRAKTSGSWHSRGKLQVGFWATKNWHRTLCVQVSVSVGTYWYVLWILTMTYEWMFTTWLNWKLYISEDIHFI